MTCAFARPAARRRVFRGQDALGVTVRAGNVAVIGSLPLFVVLGFLINGDGTGFILPSGLAVIAFAIVAVIFVND